MSSTLCIDPKWQRYYESLEFPISQAPENCEEIDAYNPPTETSETSCVPQTINAFPTSGLWRAESPDTNREIALADVLSFISLWQLAELLKKIYRDLRGNSSIPSYNKKPINTAAAQVEFISQRGRKGPNEAARYYSEDAQTLGFYAQKLTALLAPGILPDASREALRSLAIHLFIHNAEYLGKIGSYPEALEALSRAAALLSDDERLLLDPVLRGTPPQNENDLGGMVREWRVAIATAHADALVREDHTIPPTLARELPDSDRHPANLYLASILMRLEQIDTALKQGQLPPDRAATRRFFATALWYYGQLPARARTDLPIPPSCTLAYLDDVSTRFESLNGRSEDAQARRAAVAPQQAIADTPLSQEIEREIRRLFATHKYAGAERAVEGPGGRISLARIEAAVRAQSPGTIVRLDGWCRENGIDALSPDVRALLLIHLDMDPELRTPSDGQIATLVQRLQAPDALAQSAAREAGKADGKEREEAKERGIPHAK